MLIDGQKRIDAQRIVDAQLIKDKDKRAQELQKITNNALKREVTAEKKAAEEIAVPIAVTGLAASPISTAQAIPLTPTAITPVEIVSPTAVVAPKKVKRVRARRQVQPMFINQIQISN